METLEKNSTDRKASFAVQPEDRFNVRAAERDLAAIAEQNSIECIELLIALVIDGNVLEESETTMGASEAYALLRTIGEDQRIPGVSSELYLLRVSRPQLAPQLIAPRPDRF